AIRAVICIGKKTLNHHYSKTDQLDLYCIAMVLDPRLKLLYFQSLEWETEWTDKA
ncbi:hypothetical protein BJV74DRAFT_733917, partial [Russula compacta]